MHWTHYNCKVNFCQQRGKKQFLITESLESKLSLFPHPFIPQSCCWSCIKRHLLSLHYTFILVGDFSGKYLVQLNKYSKDRSIICFVIEIVKSLLLSYYDWKKPGKWKNRPTSETRNCYRTAKREHGPSTQHWAHFKVQPWPFLCGYISNYNMASTAQKS